MLLAPTGIESREEFITILNGETMEVEPLKVQSSEMDLAENGIIRKTDNFLKEYLC